MSIFTLQESGNKKNAGKYTLVLFLLLLAANRNHEANTIAREYGNYCDDEQNKVIDDLIQGTRDKDEQLVNR